MKLFFTGDIYLSPVGQKDFFDSSLVKIIKKSDLCCCNLEGAVSERKFVPKIGPSIRQDLSVVSILKEYGFHMFNLANNHIMDCGIAGLTDTLEALKGEIVLGAGVKFSDVYQEYIYEKDGMKVGFLSFAENGFGSCLEEGNAGFAWIFHDSVEKRIKDVKNKVDYLILNCHIGAERFDYPLPEVKRLFHRFIDWGVDFIIGHHPHVIQGIEEYQKGVIFYSLGNTYFDLNIENEHPDSFCVELKLENGKKPNYEIVPIFYQDGKMKLGGNAKKKVQSFEKVLESSEKYRKEIDAFCNKMYKNIYLSYYYDIIGLNRNSKRSQIKFIILMFLGKTKVNDLFLYHNIGIETHRWICERAVLNLTKGRSV